MSTDYRVDRCLGVAPCGMNSIRYLGGSLREAQKVYRATSPGKDAWDQPEPMYGVLLSRWDGKDYRRVAFKTCAGPQD